MRTQLSRLSVVLSAALVILIGLITLLGLLVGDDLGGLTLLVTLGEPFSIRNLAEFFVRVTVVTISLTIVIGILNLLYIHVRRVAVARTVSARLTSIVLVASFVLTLVLYRVDRDASMFLLEDVQIPIESALASLLFFVLVFGGFRMLKDRVTVPRLLFVVTVLLVLLSSLTLPGLDFVNEVSNWLLNVPVNGGARGILLGIALATVITGLRVLIGQDRSYGE